MLDLPLISVLEVFELVALATLAACTVWLLTRSMPVALESRQKRVEEIAAKSAASVAEIVDERAVWKAQGERLAAEVEAYLDQIERKRRSTAASASRLTTLKEPPKLETMSRAEQIALARSRAG